MPARKLTYRPTSLVAALPAAHHKFSTINVKISNIDNKEQ